MSSTPEWLARPVAHPSLAPLFDESPGALEALSQNAPRSTSPHPFGIDNLGASAVATKLYRAIPGAAATFAQIGIVVPYRGSVVAMALRANANKGAGVASFTAFNNDVEMTGATLTWPTGVNKATAKFAPGTYGFAADSEIDIRASTDGAYTPITTDILVELYLLQDPSVI